MTITATTIDLTWTAPSGAVSGYDVLARVSGGGWTQVANNVTGTSYTVTGLTPLTAYDFMVFALNSAGPGAGAIASAQTIGAVPNAPGGFAAAAGSPAYSAVNLSWTAPATDPLHGPAASYTVSYRPNNTGAWTVAQSGITGLSATIPGLSHSALYGFLVDAINAIGTNVAGATTTITTDYAAPNPPTITTVTAPVDGTTSKLAVTFSGSVADGTHDAATLYDIRWSVHGAGAWTTVASVSSGAVITGLAAGTSYDVQMRAWNASTGAPSAWTASTTAGTWACGFAVVNPLPTPYSFAHGSYPITQVTVTGTFTTVEGAWGSSPTVEPTSGWTAFSAYSGMMVQYLGGGASASIGTVYLWVRAKNAGGVVIGEIAASGYTTT